VVEPPRSVGRAPAVLVVLRLVLAALVLLALAAAPFERAQHVSLAELYAAVGTGEVDEVQVIGELLPAGISGSSGLEMRWRQGTTPYVTEVLQTTPGADLSDYTRKERQVERTSDDVVVELRSRDHDVRVVTESWTGRISSRTVLGRGMPSWFGLMLLTVDLLTLGLVIGGPEPARATRWAWFWLIWNPVGALAFLLLSGPVPGLPAPRSPRRLTGGWGLLLALLLAPALPGWAD